MAQANRVLMLVAMLTAGAGSGIPFNLEVSIIPQSRGVIAAHRSFSENGNSDGGRMDPAGPLPFRNPLNAMATGLAQKRFSAFSFNDEGQCPGIDASDWRLVLSALGVSHAAICALEFGCEACRVFSAFCGTNFDTNLHEFLLSSE